ncbi:MULTISPECIES: hypothetical protein [Pseudomonas]|jgi:hypothetical protein|uniref:Uncharacterized protein n=1 Tax=Pseudomonas soli TaxID=1306993 RepID=A0A2V4HZM9_9PSED|nr:MULTISPECIES: hypothetical protein [Pseudomonas]MDF9756400.1 tRNA nucleotidyltransferase (CCA-adding enzyme) [Pseudomonas hunanensis]PYB79743.1 hypothetical protein DMX07_17015 [Pseudomonas soli]
MVNDPGDFNANVARFKAIADKKLARFRASAQYDDFLSDDAIDAFAKVEGSAYAGRPHKPRKPSAA